jgi:hypothetical protein
MTHRLLDYQADLLRYLTSGDAIFGRHGDAPASPRLKGIDPTLLRLEARFSYDKRMEKIVAVFPRTFGLLGEPDSALARAFVDACPPSGISRIENARQFYGFLFGRWQREQPDPPWIPEVAACELACAEARVHADAPSLAPARTTASPGGVRRAAGVVLLRCAYDVRPIFESASAHDAPVERDTSLGVAVPPDGDEPQILELSPAIFDLLAGLEDWTDAEFFATPELSELIADLAGHGLIEVEQ